MDGGALPGHNIEDGEGLDNGGGSAIPTISRYPPMPPELIDTIIDMLHADRAALKTCALVSRSWVPASRHHLFSKVTITWGSDPYFSKVLSSPRCTVAPAVKHLVLRTIQDLSQNICGLPNVTQLSIHRFILFRASIFPPASLIPLLRNLESLHIEDAILDRDGAFLLALLHHTPRLRSFSCGDITDFGEEAVQSGQIPSLYEADLIPRLKSLTVCTYDRPLVLDWFVAWWKSTVPPLMILDLELHDNAKLDKSMSLFEAIGSSLQVFRLRGSPRKLSTTAPCFPFLTHPQSLSIDYGAWADVLDSNLNFPIRALRNITSPQLQELTITLTPRCFFHTSPTVWSELDSFLEAPQFIPTLRMLTIRFRHITITSSGVSSVEQDTASRLSLSAARGILRVQFLG